MASIASPSAETWPALPLEAWRETRDTLHLWTQIVGKVRVALAPWINHSWQSALYVTARGLTTSVMPHGADALQMDFDFLAHQLVLQSSAGRAYRLALRSRTVADFHAEVGAALEAVGAPVRLHGVPNELPDAIPFAEDRVHGTYDPVHAERFWRVLVAAERVCQQHRSAFLGKTSPVHFFWGSFDLAVTRFSGRPAPPHPGGVPNLPDAVAREAYSHEVFSAGFWPGGAGWEEPVFYAYAYPEPEGFREGPVEPEAAAYNARLGEFVLPYEAVRRARDPEATLLRFLDSAYAAAADRGGWDRAALECEPGRPGVPRPVPGPEG
ncbi:DUF5996 family protein [Thiohalorhabdus sp. Cl-TMA]|uniref:DUF5996 family protein n=1 Tax=Thiohalorhabdus methylotrophus TaxID=3242694 RepID=A0ABV4TR92_9GAMM